jgi:hypothetical protein
MSINKSIFQLNDRLELAFPKVLDVFLSSMSSRVAKSEDDNDSSNNAEFKMYNLVLFDSRIVAAKVCIDVTPIALLRQYSNIVLLPQFLKKI